MTLWLTYSESRTGGGISPGEENDAWPSYEDTYIHFTPTGLRLDRPEDVGAHPIEPFDKKVRRGDTVHVVIARYKDGDTFQSTYGNWCVVGAYLDPKRAARVTDMIREDERAEREFSMASWKANYGKQKRPEPPQDKYEGYKPWRGYFEQFESIDVHTFLTT